LSPAIRHHHGGEKASPAWRPRRPRWEVLPRLRPAIARRPIRTIAILASLPLLLCGFPLSLHAADTIRIAYPSTSFTTLPILAAMKHGQFQQEGLRAELIFMRPNISVTAVVTGQVEFATVHGSIVRAAARGLPVKGLMVVADKPAYYLVAKAAVRSVDALKGRSVGVISLGGSVHLMTKEFFSQNRLDPDKDISIVVTGDHNASIQALQGGRVDAIVIAIPWHAVAEKSGFHSLAYFGDIMRMPMAGLGANDDTIKKKPELVKRTLKATLKAIDFVKDPAHRRQVVALIDDWFKVGSDLAEAAYRQMVDIYPASGTVSDEAIEKDLEIAGQVGGIKNRVAVARVVDFRLVKEARAELAGKKN
jgi:NitT/TauT family transport system substrate-binding protein